MSVCSSILAPENGCLQDDHGCEDSRIYPPRNTQSLRQRPTFFAVSRPVKSNDSVVVLRRRCFSGKASTLGRCKSAVYSVAQWLLSVLAFFFEAKPQSLNDKNT